MSSADRLQRRLGILVLVGLLLCLLVPAALLVAWRTHLQRDVETELRAIKAAGHPTSGAELNRWQANVPDPENAALALTRAFALMGSYPDERSNEVARFKAPPRGQALTLAERELLAGHVALNDAALAQAREALRLPKCRYPADYTAGFATSLPHLGKIRGLARTARAAALLTLDRQQTTNVTTHITTMLALAQSLDAEPTLLAQLARVSILAQAANTTERALALPGLGDDELAKIAAHLAAADHPGVLARGLIGERAIGIPLFRTSWAELKRLNDEAGEGPAEGQNAPPTPGRLPAFLRLTGVFERDLRFYLRTMQALIGLASQPPPRSLAAKDLVERAAEDAKHNYYILSGLLLPALAKVTVKEASGLASLRVAQTAMALERFRRANHRLPAALLELCPRFLPAVPADPFDGAPLRYRPLPQGYVVYSVGPDGSDNDGQERPAKASPDEPASYDITVTVER